VHVEMFVDGFSINGICQFHGVCEGLCCHEQKLSTFPSSIFLKLLLFVSLFGVVCVQVLELQFEL